MGARSAVERSSRSVSSRALFTAAFAILLAAAMGAGAHFGGAQGAAFGLFALLTIGGGVVCLFEKSVVRGAFSLFSTFVGTAGLFLLLQSDFLAMAQILICVGGILVMILFGAMSAPIEIGERRLTRIFAALLFLAPICGLVAWRCADVGAFRSAHALAQEDENPNPDVPRIASDIVDPIPTSDAGSIGVALADSKQYVVAFEVSGLLLVVALVAALYIARRREHDSEGTN